MVGSVLEALVANGQDLGVVREYQGSSYGSIRFSGGEPEGHYRTLDFSTGVFSAQDKRFNAYLRDQFATDVLTLYDGQTPVPSTEGQEDLHSGHSANRRQHVDGRIVEVNYWSNAQRCGSLPHDRMYAVTVRMEAMPGEVAGLQERMTRYLSQLQETFGLRSTNNVTQKGAA